MCVVQENKCVLGHFASCHFFGRKCIEREKEQYNLLIVLISRIHISYIQI